MSRNGLYTLVGVLVLVVIGLGIYMVYQKSQEPALQITVDKGGIEVKGNG